MSTGGKGSGGQGSILTENFHRPLLITKDDLGIAFNADALAMVQGVRNSPLAAKVQPRLGASAGSGPQTISLSIPTTSKSCTRVKKCPLLTCAIFCGFEMLFFGDLWIGTGMGGRLCREDFR